MTTNVARVMGDLHHALEGAARPERPEVEILIARGRLAVLTLQREEVELLDRLERALDADPAQVPDLSGQIRAKRRELTSLQALVDELGAGR